MVIIYIYRVQKNIGKIIFQNDMKKITEIFIRKEVKEAVITVSAYFNAIQREATKKNWRIS